ncbi:hypothetical protein ACTFIU_009071 [Dictyostelium citrinum]
MNKKFSFPSNFQVNVAPFGTPEGITASSTLKNNDADLFIFEKRINDTLKPLLLMITMKTHDSTNVDVELIRYLAESIKDTPKMFDETETERVKKWFQQPFSEEQEVNLPVGGLLLHFKQVWKQLGLPSFCPEVVSGLKVHILPNFKSVHNPITISIPEGPKSEFITKEVYDLLVDDAIEQVLSNQYSKLVFYSNVYTVPKR